MQCDVMKTNTPVQRFSKEKGTEIFPSVVIDFIDEETEAKGG